MILEILLGSAVLCIIILSIIIFKFIRDTERLEEIIESLEESNNGYEYFFRDFKRRINESNSKLRQIDRLGSFEADDEVGFIFKEILTLANDLNQF